MRAVALILAAGSGRRLGLGPKALLMWEGSVLVVRAVQAAITAGLRPVVTAGPRFDEIDRHLAEAVRPVQLVNVPDAVTGMSASWRAGIDAIEALDGLTSATPVVVMLVDQPGVGAPVLGRLLSRFDSSRVVRATWGGQPGHPVVMSLKNARAAAELSSGDEAVRTWMRTHAHLHDLVECADLGEGGDIDTTQDLQSWAWRHTLGQV